MDVFWLNVPTGVYIWESKKVTHEQFVLLSAEFRAGHATGKRDASLVLTEEREKAARDLGRAERDALAAATCDVRQFAEVDAFVELFQRPAFRRPLLAIIGGTNLGKSELAAVVLGRVGKHLGLSSFFRNNGRKRCLHGPL